MFIFPDDKIFDALSACTENSEESFAKILTIVDKRSRKNIMIVTLADKESNIKNYRRTRADMRTIMLEMNGIPVPVLMLRYGTKIFNVGINPFHSEAKFNSIRTDLMYSCLVTSDTGRIIEKSEHPFMAPQISKLSRNVRSQTATGWTDEAFAEAWKELTSRYSPDEMWNMNSGRERRFSR